MKRGEFLRYTLLGVMALQFNSPYKFICTDGEAVDNSICDISIKTEYAGSKTGYKYVSENTYMSISSGGFLLTLNHLLSNERTRTLNDDIISMQLHEFRGDDGKKYWDTFEKRIVEILAFPDNSVPLKCTITYAEKNPDMAILKYPHLCDNNKKVTMSETILGDSDLLKHDEELIILKPNKTFGRIREKGRVVLSSVPEKYSKLVGYKPNSYFTLRDTVIKPGDSSSVVIGTSGKNKNKPVGLIAGFFENSFSGERIPYALKINEFKHKLYNICEM